MDLKQVCFALLAAIVVLSTVGGASPGSSACRCGADSPANEGLELGRAAPRVRLP